MILTKVPRRRPSISDRCRVLRARATVQHQQQRRGSHDREHHCTTAATNTKTPPNFCRRVHRQRLHPGRRQAPSRQGATDEPYHSMKRPCRRRCRAVVPLYLAPFLIVRSKRRVGTARRRQCRRSCAFASTTISRAPASTARMRRSSMATTMTTIAPSRRIAFRCCGPR